MSEAIYVATRNFANTFNFAMKMPYNPLRLLRKGAIKTAEGAFRDAPSKGIYRNSIPVHLAKVALMGPRYGAKGAASVLHGVHAFAKTVKQQVVGTHTRPEPPQNLKKQTFGENLAGLGGTLTGGLLGLVLKSAEHIGVTGIYAAALFLGVTVGCVGLPVAGVYALYVLASSDKRQALRDKRTTLNKKEGLEALLAEDGASSPQQASLPKVRSAPDMPSTKTKTLETKGAKRSASAKREAGAKRKAATARQTFVPREPEFYGEEPWHEILRSPGHLAPVRTRRS